jgi:hypothetical protein
LVQLSAALLATRPSCFLGIHLLVKTGTRFIASLATVIGRTEYSVYYCYYCNNCCTFFSPAAKFQELPDFCMTIATGLLLPLQPLQSRTRTQGQVQQVEKELAARAKPPSGQNGCGSSRKNFEPKIRSKWLLQHAWLRRTLCCTS